MKFDADLNLVASDAHCAVYVDRQTKDATIVGAHQQFDTDHPIYDQATARMRELGYTHIVDQGVVEVEGIWHNYFTFRRA